MKKRIVSMMSIVCASAMLLTGCASEISNEYVTISKYKGVEVEHSGATEVTDADVESEIANALDMYTTTEEVKGRAVKDGDVVVIDYVGKIAGKTFEGGSADDSELEIGSNSFIAGFEEGIIGHKIGDKFDLELTFPDDYWSEEYAGKDVIFSVTLDKIVKKTVPELTDEFVQSVSETATTVDEYKAEIRANLEEYYEGLAYESLLNSAWAAVVENTTVTTYPTEELQQIIEDYNQQYKSMAEMYGMKFEEFIQAYFQMDKETYNAELSRAAKEQLRDKMMTDLIIEKGKVDVSEEKMNERYEEYAAYYGYESVDAMVSALEEAGTLSMLEEMARLDIVKSWVADNCKTVEPQETEAETETEE